MTKTVSRKTGKKGHSDSAKNTSTDKRAAKTTKRRSQYQQETSRRWIIVVGTVCFLIVAVVVLLYFVPSAFKDKASRKQDLNEQKKVVKDDSVGGKRKAKKNAEGKTI